MSEQAIDFWDSNYSSLEEIKPPDEICLAVERAKQWFGPLEGKKILDIGCGNGGTSMLFAEVAAQVTAVDYSKAGISKLARYAEARGLHNLKAVVGDAMDIDQLGTFDFIFGSLVLHHLEPFESFCKTLQAALRPGGAAFFYENNAGSNLLVWCRKHLVGKFGVPKYGDTDEFPLMPSEIDLLRKYFSVTIEIPEMVFMRLISIYLLKRRLHGAAKAMDDMLFRFNIGKKFSYRQYVEIRA